MSRTAVLTDVQWERIAALLPSSDGLVGGRPEGVQQEPVDPVQCEDMML